MNMKRFFICIMLTFITLGLMGCSSNTANDDNHKTREVIRIGIMPDVESVPFIIAEKNGYFDKEGVKVKLEGFASAKDRDSALQSGQLEGEITDIVAVLFANEGGYKLKICAKTDGRIELLAGGKNAINSISDLTGKSIGMSKNTIMEYTADQMLESQQIDTHEVNKINIPPLETRRQMLEEGKVDAIILPDPLAGLAVANGAKILATTDEMDNKAGVIAFSARCLEENPDGVKAVFRAYNAAVQYLNSEPRDNYIDFVIEKQRFPEQVRQSLTLPVYSPAQLPDAATVDNVIKWMQKHELIKNSYDYKELVDENVLR
jgi:NitT/TauT family transport system substrate-binding protein